MTQATQAGNPVVFRGRRPQVQTLDGRLATMQQRTERVLKNAAPDPEDLAALIEEAKLLKYHFEGHHGAGRRVRAQLNTIDTLTARLEGKAEAVNESVNQEDREDQDDGLAALTDTNGHLTAILDSIRQNRKLREELMVQIETLQAEEEAQYASIGRLQIDALLVS
jgi:ribosomal protein S15P/S13E